MNDNNVTPISPNHPAGKQKPEPRTKRETFALVNGIILQTALVASIGIVLVACALWVWNALLG